MTSSLAKPDGQTAVYREAAELLADRGSHAGTVAALEADAALDRGDLDAQRRWLDILVALDESERQRRRTGERLH